MQRWEPRPQSDYIRRAMAAYFRRAGRTGRMPDQPNTALSWECDLDRRHYVVLANINGILAVYRVKSDGCLKRLRRWPKALEGLLKRSNVVEPGQTQHSIDRPYFWIDRGDF
jgi:hypothetical protein